jgi:hypothetical protein
VFVASLEEASTPSITFTTPVTAEIIQYYKSIRCRFFKDMIETFGLTNIIIRFAKTTSKYAENLIVMSNEANNGRIYCV